MNFAEKALNTTESCFGSIEGYHVQINVHAKNRYFRNEYKKF